MMAVSKFSVKKVPKMTRNVKYRIEMTPTASYTGYIWSVAHPWHVRQWNMFRHAQRKVSKVVYPPFGLGESPPSIGLPATISTHVVCVQKVPSSEQTSGHLYGPPLPGRAQTWFSIPAGMPPSTPVAASTSTQRPRIFPMKKFMPMIPNTKNIHTMRTMTSIIRGMDSIRVLTRSRIPGTPLIVRSGRRARKARRPDTLPPAPGIRKL